MSQLKIESDENLNPLSAKGRLSYSSFCATMLAIVVFNLIVFALIRAQLLPARVAANQSKMIQIYALWFVLASLGFSAMANTFIKRWTTVLGQEKLAPFWKSCLRILLLSPLFSYPATLVTLLIFPASPLRSKAVIILSLVVSLALATGVTGLVGLGTFGLEKIGFRESSSSFVQVGLQVRANPFPSDQVLRPVLAAATPGMRYLAWLAADFFRTKALFGAIEFKSEELCRQRMGFLGVEVRDCFFYLLRKMTSESPLVSPYFALFFESKYRKSVLGESDSALQVFASNMLIVSNQLELIEPGPMFVERKHFLRPIWLLHAFGSPEVPLVEAGQDAQRIVLVSKILPLFQMEIGKIEQELNQNGSELGPNEVTIRSELADLKRRAEALKRDPLMLAR